MLEFEHALQEQGIHLIAGIDEAGRGPLAGPVVAAALILPPKFKCEGIDDSKKLSRLKRQHLYEILFEETEYGVGIVNHERIDEINIYQATIEAMLLAVQNLPIKPEHLLVDGGVKLATLIPHTIIIKGDQRSLTIAAASIIAKETRDLLMEKYHTQYPAYGFDQHKGYGTRAHVAALNHLGRCPIHRKTFKF